MTERKAKDHPHYPSPVTDISTPDEAAEVYRKMLEPSAEEKASCEDLAARVSSVRKGLTIRLD
jgi:hypothetical protein